MLERWMRGAAVFAPEGDGMGDGGDAGAAPESLMFPSEASSQEGGAVPERDGAVHPPEAKDGAKTEGKGEADTPDPADEIPEDGRYDFSLPEGMAIDEKLAEAM